jgi:uncharacterized repeat protein (TIGR01451 family)
MPVQSPFSRPFLAALAVLSAASIPFWQPAIQAQAKRTPDTPVPAEPIVSQALYVAESKPVRDIVPVFVGDTGATHAGTTIRTIRRNPELRPDALEKAGYEGGDGALQSAVVEPLIPAPALTFEGISDADNGAVLGYRVAPPDTVGAVGPNHYVQMVNSLYRVFSKTGTPLTPALRLSALWASAGRTDVCATRDPGDPIVLYDRYADRWILSQFGFASSSAPPYYECIAISTTGDPAGSYYVYSFLVPNAEFPDYPKLGVWPDAYYMTVNQFSSGGPFNGTGAYAFERERMLRGDPTARLVYFNLSLAARPEGIGGLLPADADSLLPPAPGAPNVQAYFTANEFADPADGLRLFNFAVNWANPAASTFTERPESSLAAPLAVASFNPLSPSGRADVIQPNGEGLDSLSDRLMHRLQYRNFGTHETLVTTHTVNANGSTALGSYRAAVRYYHLRRAGGSYSVFDQGTYDAGASLSRWMGSAAMDAAGNLAVGYSTANAATFPSLAYAGRLAGDPAGSLFQGEATLFAGSGSQSGSGNRWGDYSSLNVDPADDCSFWFTSEYYAVTGGFDWRTRVGRFRFPAANCATPARGTVTVTVTNCASSAPIAGATVSVGGIAYGTTGAAGSLTATVAPGTYAVSAAAPGFPAASGSTSVSAGGSSSLGLCLAGAPAIVVESAVLTAESCTPANGTADPGELVTYALTLRNAGSVATSNLVATLPVQPAVVAPSAPQNFGAIPAGGTATRNFSWTAAGACGASWTATFTLADGATSYPAVTIGDTYGLAPVFSQAFDGVIAPALPAGWTASLATGPSPTWVTSLASPDSAPNAAFVDNPAVVSDRLLDSPGIAIPAGGGVLEFRSNYSTETGFDGGVLEVSIASGAYQDILAAGGSFLAGGYTGTISTLYSSPIAGRQAWTGSSGGYLTTRASLPPAASGQTIRIRFRSTTDDGVSGTGWRVDGVRILPASPSCAGCGGGIPPNLAVVSLKAPGQVASGATIAITETTFNNGAGAAGSSVTHLHLSPNKTLGSGDVLLATRNVGALAAGTGSTGTTNVTLPTRAPGVYYLIAQADGPRTVSESDEGDNTRTKTLVIGPDLVVSSLAVSPTSPSSTSPATVTVTTKNTGAVTTGVATQTRVYRSANKTLDATDVLVGTIAVPVLAGKATASQSFNVTLPAGSYYLLAVADATPSVVEARETNNRRTLFVTVF